jgi:sulfur-oxidizing protein SoxX
VLKASFRDQGIAKVDRLNQDLGQSACSPPTPPSRRGGQAIEAECWPPSSGPPAAVPRRLARRRKAGAERPWHDLDRQVGGATSANGGNCYNCHQISKQEISYGTIGPSLYNYGKNRGVTDPAPGRQAHRRVHLGQALQRQGLQRLLQHAAFRPHGPAGREADGHLMALLLDPKSPVNQ